MGGGYNAAEEELAEVREQLAQARALLRKAIAYYTEEASAGTIEGYAIAMEIWTEGARAYLESERNDG